MKVGKYFETINQNIRVTRNANEIRLARISKREIINCTTFFSNKYTTKTSLDKEFISKFLWLSQIFKMFSNIQHIYIFFSWGKTKNILAKAKK